MIHKISPTDVPYDRLIAGICRTPFYKHAQGCPNYHHKHNCPPQALITYLLDFEQELFVISTAFNVGAFAERMRIAHPEWKESSYPDTPAKGAVFLQDMVLRLQEKHPEWPKEYFPPQSDGSWESSRNWYNPRRWQGIARKERDTEVQTFKAMHPDLVVNTFPEAHGINVTGMMHNLDITLNWQWPPPHDPQNMTYLVAIAGHAKNSSVAECNYCSSARNPLQKQTL